LISSGFEVILVGRRLSTSPNLDRNYKVQRFRVVFNKGFLFYSEFNLRLFFWLLFKNYDVYHANDLDTLLPMWLISKIKNKPIVYDSHEYFTGVPEIQNRPFVKWFWESIEKSIFPKLKYVFTVNNSIANLYFKAYSVRPMVLRNVPLKKPIRKFMSRDDLQIPNNKKVLILQGAGINIDRGAEELLEAISVQQNFFLCIVGKGDVIKQLKKRSKKSDLTNKVLFVDTLPYEQMMQYTLNADVGLSLDKPNNLNYLNSLPNKVFDYLKAGLPIVCSDLSELRMLIKKYNCGEIVKDHLPTSILNSLENLFSDSKYLSYKKNASVIIQELNWENESKVLINCYKNIG
jgi:glycosyltransferase involved in cell wall biosynthesis